MLYFFMLVGTIGIIYSIVQIGNVSGFSYDKIEIKKIIILIFFLIVCLDIYGWSLFAICELPKDLTYSYSTTTEYEVVSLDVVKSIKNENNNWFVIFEDTDMPYMTKYTDYIKSTNSKLSYIFTLKTGESESSLYLIHISEEEFTRIMAED